MGGKTKPSVLRSTMIGLKDIPKPPTEEISAFSFRLRYQKACGYR